MKKHIQRFQEILKLVLLLLMLVLTFSYAMFQGGFVSWFLFYSFLPFALYAICLALYSLTNFSGERIFVDKEFSAGEKIKVKISLERHSRFPLLYLIVEDLGDISLSEMGLTEHSKKIFFPWFKKTFQFDYAINNLPRGEHLFSGICVKTGDVLGLIEKEWIVPIENKILVYPAYEELVYRPVKRQIDIGMTAANERTQRDTSMSVGVREYQPGDRFSWIDWKASAKRNNFMTKEFEQRQSHDVMVVMDCALNPRFEAVVSLTTSLIRSILRQGAQVGLLTSSGERIMIPVRGGESHQQQLFYHLAKIKGNSPVSFDRMLAGEAFLGRQSNTLKLVTARFTQELLENVSIYSRRNGAVTIYLVKGKQEALSRMELRLKAAANSQGIRVTIVYEGHFAKAFSEVR